MKLRLLTAAAALFVAPSLHAQEGSPVTPITTDAQAAGAVHAVFLVQQNAYFLTSVLWQGAESAALRLLDPASPALPVQGKQTGKRANFTPLMGEGWRRALGDATFSQAGASAAPVVVPCPDGGSTTFQWIRDRGTLVLLADYDACRQFDGFQTTIEQNGPIAIGVEISDLGGLRVSSVRFGRQASASAPAADYVQSFVQRSPDGDFLSDRLSGNYVVSGRFMQRIGDSGRLEGDFSYDMNGWHREETFVIFSDLNNTLGTIERTFIGDALSMSGSQGHGPGADGVLQTEDDTFDIAVRYRSGKFTETYRDPFVSVSMPFGFQEFRTTDSMRFLDGGTTSTVDGTVSVGYPKLPDSGCTDGTFRVRTREKVFNVFPTGPTPPLFTQGSLRINSDVQADFSRVDEFSDPAISVSLNRGTPASYPGWASLEGAILCFVDLL